MGRVRSALSRSAPLPLASLCADWVTVSELLTRACLRPNLPRIRRVHEAGLVDEAASSLGLVLAECESSVYQVLNEILGDRTFAFSPAEADYIDGMASALFGRVQRGPGPLVLSSIAVLYVSPRPYAYSKARVSSQKSASSLMRLHEVAVENHDWAAYRAPDEPDDRVFRSSAFVGSLKPGHFPSLPNAVIDSFPSLRIHPFLHFILKHFLYACVDAHHPARDLSQHNYEREWAWSVANAFMTKATINRRVFVELSTVLAYLERVVVGHPLQIRETYPCIRLRRTPRTCFGRSVPR